MSCLLAALLARVEELTGKVSQQENIIAELVAGANVTNARTSAPAASGSASARPPSIPFFSGEGENCTSAKVKSFIYNAKKAGVFSNYDDSRMLALPECYLTDSAATWLEKLEEEGQKPSTVAELRGEMMKEFVPPDEKSRAKIQLMDMKMKGSMDTHVKKFKKLVEITGTPLKESYVYFFMSLPAAYKEDFHKKFPGGEPSEGTVMSDVYKFARDLATAKHWSSEERKTANNQKQNEPKNTTTGTHNKPSSNKDKSGKKGTSTAKSDSLESWGVAQPGEKYLFIKAGRCMDCGKKGWSDPDHPCRKKRDNSKSTGDEKKSNAAPWSGTITW